MLVHRLCLTCKRIRSGIMFMELFSLIRLGRRNENPLEGLIEMIPTRVPLVTLVGCPIAPSLKHFWWVYIQYM